MIKIVSKDILKVVNKREERMLRNDDKTKKNLLELSFFFFTKRRCFSVCCVIIDSRQIFLFKISSTAAEREGGGRGVCLNGKLFRLIQDIKNF